MATNMIAIHSALITQKVSAMSSGQEAGVKSIFGTDWDTIGSSGEKKEFGKQFKEAVDNGTITDLEWLRIENTGRYDVYRKI